MIRSGISLVDDIKTEFRLEIKSSRVKQPESPPGIKHTLLPFNRAHPAEEIFSCVLKVLRSNTKLMIESFVSLLLGIGDLLDSFCCFHTWSCCLGDYFGCFFIVNICFLSIFSIHFCFLNFFPVL